LSTLQVFNENRWRPLKAFPLKILDNVSRSRSSAGIAASRRRGRTLKGTKVFFQKCTILLLTLLELVFLISVLIIPDVLADARSVSDHTAVLGTAPKEVLCRMTGSRNLGDFKQSLFRKSWTTGHRSILHYFIRFVGLMILGRLR